MLKIRDLIEKVNKKAEEIDKKRPVIYYRIRTLYDKMGFIMKYNEIESCSGEISLDWNPRISYKRYEMNTEYGKRTLSVSYTYGTCYDYYLLKYYSTDDFVIFSIDDSGNITPCPMLNLTAKDIDLAILEFENAIEIQYQKALENKKLHEECEKPFKVLVSESEVKEWQ